MSDFAFARMAFGLPIYHPFCMRSRTIPTPFDHYGTCIRFTLRFAYAFMDCALVLYTPSFPLPRFAGSCGVTRRTRLRTALISVVDVRTPRCPLFWFTPRAVERLRFPHCFTACGLDFPHGCRFLAFNPLMFVIIRYTRALPTRALPCPLPR